jgi:hypothetical protein
MRDETVFVKPRTSGMEGFILTTVYIRGSLGMWTR